MPSTRPPQIGACHGFSLVETLVATTILVVALAGLAQLFSVAAHANAGSKKTTLAAVLAEQKMEQLRGLAWGFDALGRPLSDTSTDTTSPTEAPWGGTGLGPSPSDSLARNASGYCDFLDDKGRPLGGGSTPPASASFVRRWSIEPLPVDPGNAIVIQVRVLGLPPRSGADSRARGPGEARFLSVKTRRPWS